MKSSVRVSVRMLIAIGLLCVFALIVRAQTQRNAAAAQARKPIYITRIYTGPDGLTHSEEIEAKSDAAGNGNVIKMMPVTGAEIHRATPGTTLDWHPGPRYQYVITLSGHGEVEVADGKKIAEDPGHITLVEDIAGKGHITRTFGPDDRVSLWLPLVDQPAH
jgi:phosphoglycerol transferase MdoB-like AlkP superfamily enzyme